MRDCGGRGSNSSSMVTFVMTSGQRNASAACSIGTSMTWPRPVLWRWNKAAVIACAAVSPVTLSTTACCTSTGTPDLRSAWLLPKPVIAWITWSYAGASANVESLGKPRSAA